MVLTCTVTGSILITPASLSVYQEQGTATGREWFMESIIFHT